MGILAALVAVLALVGFLVRPRESDEGAVVGTRSAALRPPPAIDSPARAWEAAATEDAGAVEGLDAAAGEVGDAGSAVAGEPQAPDRPASAGEARPGDVEVLVLSGDEPVRGASVLASVSRKGEMLDDLESKGESVLRATTDARGSARFGGLAPGFYAIGVVAGSGLHATTYCRIAPERSPRQHVVAFGSGAIVGRVYASDGTPIAGDRLILVERTPQQAARFHAAATTAEDGYYRIAGLGASEFSVYSRAGGAGGRRIDVALAAGESRNVDFGSPEPAASWSGTLRVASGAAAIGVEAFGVHEVTRGESSAVECDEHGRFSADLAPGSYRATLDLGSRELDLGAIELASGALERDLFVPGVTVAGRIHWFPAASESGERRPDVRVLARRADAAEDAEPLRALATSDGYALIGLERGAYFVSVERSKLLGASARGCEVKVDGTRDAIVLDLIVSAD